MNCSGLVFHFKMFFCISVVHGNNRYYRYLVESLKQKSYLVLCENDHDSSEDGNKVNKQINTLPAKIQKDKKHVRKKVGHFSKYTGSCKQGSFPLITKANSQARCKNFHPITIFASTRCELAFAISGKEVLIVNLFSFRFSTRINFFFSFC